MADSTTAGPSRPSGERKGVGKLPAWKKALLAGSCLVMVLGAALQGYSYVRGPGEAAQPKPPAVKPSAPKGLAPIKPFGPVSPQPSASDPATAPTTATAEGLDLWSPAVFRLGFSFFVGFCVGYALRVFFKISLIAIGLILLALFGLQYGGVVSVNWSALQQHYGSVGRWLAAQASSFRQFVTGYLPSAGLGSFGLVTGFRKNR
jgi:uncharacterized membrane protein (Fun14 family)